MGASFQVVTTSAFERDARQIIRRHPELAAVLEELISILGADPYNRTRVHDITKLRGDYIGQFFTAGEPRYRTVCEFVEGAGEGARRISIVEVR